MEINKLKVRFSNSLLKRWEQQKINFVLFAYELPTEVALVRVDSCRRILHIGGFEVHWILHIGGINAHFLLCCETNTIMIVLVELTMNRFKSLDLNSRVKPTVLDSFLQHALLASVFRCVQFSSPCTRYWIDTVQLLEATILLWATIALTLLWNFIYGWKIVVVAHLMFTQ